MPTTFSSDRACSTTQILKLFEPPDCLQAKFLWSLSMLSARSLEALW